MSHLARLFAPRAAITSSHELLQYLTQDATESAAGVTVTPDLAMRVSSVFSCVRVVSEDLAKLPLLTYRRSTGGKERATDHWLYRLLHDEPNAFQTAYEFRRMMQAHVELWGNAYAFKTVVRGEVRELLPVAPWRVQVEQFPDWRLVYHVAMPDGSTLPVPPDRIFHLPGLAFDGASGLSVISYQRETVGLALQLVRHGARLFKNGAQVGMVLEHPENISPAALSNLKKSFEERYAGVDNAHKTLLLEEGMKAAKVGLTSEEAQFLESRKFSRSEIAGFFRVPPHKIGDLERATFSNIEHQGTEYVVDALMPRAVAWESRILKSLVPPAERAVLYSAHLFNALVRGDLTTRTSAYQRAVLTGWMSRNEVRELEDLNDGPEALDEFLDPTTMAQSQKGATTDKERSA